MGVHRLLSKLASADEVPEADGAQQRSLRSSPTSTDTTSHMEFQKKSHEVEKDEAIKSVLCAALGTTLTVLILEAFRIPNSYMSLSLASTLSLLPRPPLSHVATRIGALSLGILISMIVLILFPQAPWFCIPLTGVIPAVGYAFFFKHSGPGSAYAFSAYFLALHVTASTTLVTTPLSDDFIIQALKLWSQSVIPILITYLVALAIKEKKPTPAFSKITFASIISIGLTVSIALMIAVTIKSDQATRLVMASISAIAALEIEKSTDLFFQRMMGYFVGAAVATSFIVAVVALANDITLYLLALGVLFGSLEWLACHFKNQATFYRSITAMASFSVLMIPTPDQHFQVTYHRISSSLIGFFTAIAIFLIVRECSKLTDYLTKREDLLGATS